MPVHIRLGTEKANLLGTKEDKTLMCRPDQIRIPVPPRYGSSTTRAGSMRTPPTRNVAPFNS